MTRLFEVAMSALLNTLLVAILASLVLLLCVLFVAVMVDPFWRLILIAFGVFYVGFFIYEWRRRS